MSTCAFHKNTSNTGLWGTWRKKKRIRSSQNHYHQLNGSFNLFPLGCAYLLYSSILSREIISLHCSLMGLIQLSMSVYFVSFECEKEWKYFQCGEILINQINWKSLGLREFWIGKESKSLKRLIVELFAFIKGSKKLSFKLFSLDFLLERILFLPENI